ncbi:hypothetical protein Nepgr_025291 [Nepenthes gracilis]|uniref:Magnesium chelatase n=1 Tax=Nepenthes gracilis TaxID=150966 RepID=A0AAD3T4H2_NEPGR|nr:hypothetical protein Nepgr_025291 [Nepenthes gracilis]
MPLFYRDDAVLLCIIIATQPQDLPTAKGANKYQRFVSVQLVGRERFEEQRTTISQWPPSRELIAKNIPDFEWKFKHPILDQIKRHLLTTDGSVFVEAKSLVAVLNRIIPSMPEVMRLNKLGSFSMSQLGQSKSPLLTLFKRKKSSAGFADRMPKLVRTLPMVLKYLPSDKAQDARLYILSLQFWLGRSPDNLVTFLKMIYGSYVPALKGVKIEYSDPVLFLDIGIWHPLAPCMYDDVKEYLNWYGTRSDANEKLMSPNAPVIGLVLQRSHIVTGDEGHYVAVIMELEARGAKVIPIFAGGLDFSRPVERFFADSVTKKCFVNSVVSLTGFALVGEPARQDHPRAVEAVRKLDVPYIVVLPLVFQTTEEWLNSTLGLHAIQVALQVALLELDGGMEPIVFVGRDPRTGKSHALHKRVEQLCTRAIKWAELKRKSKAEKKLAITELKKGGYNVEGLPETSEALIEDIIHDKEARFSSPNLNINFKMSIREYQRLTPYATLLGENWGKPPGNLNFDGENLLIYGKQYGIVFIGVQPTFGYEGDPMRLLFSKSASPHHGFAAYYTFVEKIFGAEAVFGNLSYVQTVARVQKCSFSQQEDIMEKHQEAAGIDSVSYADILKQGFNLNDDEEPDSGATHLESPQILNTTSVEDSRFPDWRDTVERGLEMQETQLLSLSRTLELLSPSSALTPFPVIASRSIHLAALEHDHYPSPLIPRENPNFAAPLYASPACFEQICSPETPSSATSAASATQISYDQEAFISRYTPTSPVKGCDALVEALKGRGLLPSPIRVGYRWKFTVHLRCSNIIRNALPATSKGGVFAAEGYACKPRAAWVSGHGHLRPRATNLISSLADALLTPFLGRHHRQFLYCMIAPTPSRYIPRIVKEAFFLAQSGRPGPVLIDIPKDIQQRSVVPDWNQKIKLPGYLCRMPKSSNAGQLDQMVRLISESKKPVLYVGGGCLNSSKELRKFVELTGIPVASTLMGLGSYPSLDDLSLQMLGMHGTVYANYAVDKADLLLAFGVRFDDRVTGKLEAFASRSKIVHIDIDSAEIGKNKQSHLSVCADLKSALTGMNRILEEKAAKLKLDFSPWRKELKEQKMKYPLSYRTFGDAIPPQYAIQVLDTLTNGNAIISTGVGQHQM